MLWLPVHQTCLAESIGNAANPISMPAAGPAMGRVWHTRRLPCRPGWRPATGLAVAALAEPSARLPASSRLAASGDCRGITIDTVIDSRRGRLRLVTPKPAAHRIVRRTL
ncbi:hypothetical protein FHR53_001392 [Xanthomonas arboricola]